MLTEKVFTIQSYNVADFLMAVRDYLERHREIPVLQADSSPKFEHDKINVRGYLFDTLLRTISEDIPKYARDINAFLRYGYVGNSRGGKNGLVRIPERDVNMRGVVQRFSSPIYSSFCQAIDFNPEVLELEPVKLVTHRKSGERIVGVLNRNDGRVVLYDIISYSR